MAQSITSVAGPDGNPRVSSKGGDVLDVLGSFTVNAPMAAYFGENGDTTDAPCYFGPDLGYDAGFSADGTTVEVVTPPHAKSTTAKLTIVVDSETLVSGNIEVVERNWPATLHGMRKSFPPWAHVGSRNLVDEGLE
jgi:hypothetical protein